MRRTQLEDSLKLQQFYHDIADELHWIKEHKSLINSEDVGQSLQEVQNLSKKHQVCFIIPCTHTLTHTLGLLGNYHNLGHIK